MNLDACFYLKNKILHPKRKGLEPVDAFFKMNGEFLASTKELMNESGCFLGKRERKYASMIGIMMHCGCFF